MTICEPANPRHYRSPHAVDHHSRGGESDASVDQDAVLIAPMCTDIDQYIVNCACRAAKHPRDKTPRLLHPISPPLLVWQSIVMDFNEFPKDKYGFDNALVMIDRLTKASWTG